MPEWPLVGSTKAELVQAHLGTVSLTGIGGSPVKMGLKRTVLHPQYNPSILDFDVAILELSGPLVFNKYIQPVCLPLAIQKFPVGRKCMISGWGNTQEGNGECPPGGSRSQRLHTPGLCTPPATGPRRLFFIHEIQLAHSKAHLLTDDLWWLSCYKSRAE